MITIGRLRHSVTLAQLEQKTGLSTPLVPHRVWAAIEPLPPSQDDRRTLHYVTIRYHPEVTLDSVIVFNGRELYVRGVQNVEERNIEMRLYCEEIVK